MLRTLVVVNLIIMTSLVALAQGPAQCTAALFDPSVKTDFANRAEKMRVQMLQDFETFLRVYYELKVKSKEPRLFMNYAYNPDPKARQGLSVSSANRLAHEKVEKMPDFSFQEFALFREKMQADPRLANNLFMKKLIEYGSGAANDVFQRLGSYVSDEVRVEFQGEAKAADFNFYRRELLEFSVNMSGLALLSYPKVYNRVSVEYDYPLNYRLEQPEKEARFFDMVLAQLQGFEN